MSNRNQRQGQNYQYIQQYPEQGAYRREQYAQIYPQYQGEPCPPEAPFLSTISGMCVSRLPRFRANSAQECPASRNLFNPVTRNCIGRNSKNEQRIASYRDSEVWNQLTPQVQQQIQGVNSAPNQQNRYMRARNFGF